MSCKRCTNCGKYPFCKEIQEPSFPNDCDKWIKRNVIKIEKGGSSYVEKDKERYSVNK